MSWKTPIQLHPHSFQYQKELIVSSHHSPLNFDAIYKACLLPTSPKRYAKHVLSALSTHYTQRQYIGMVWRMVIPARFVFISPCDCIRVYNTNSTRSLSASVMCICKKSAAHYRPEVPRGFQEVDSQITWQWPTMVVTLPALSTEVNIRKVLRPANSTQVFLGFPVSISKCWDGSQDSKLPLHASHVALPT